MKAVVARRHPLSVVAQGRHTAESAAASNSFDKTPISMAVRRTNSVDGPSRTGIIPLACSEGHISLDGHPAGRSWSLARGG